MSRSLSSSAGRSGVLTQLNILLTLLMGITGCLLIAGMVMVAGMPTKFLYPDDSCAIVVEANGAGHDCGWEEGRRHFISYIGWNADLSRLHGKR